MALESYQTIETTNRMTTIRYRSLTTTAYDEAQVVFLAVAPDPDQLVADESVVEETLEGPTGLVIEAGEIWTAEAISVLSSIMDSFIDQYSLEGETDTVADLASALETAEQQLEAAQQNVAVDDRHTQRAGRGG